MNEAAYDLATELAIEQSFERNDEHRAEMEREDAEFGTFGDQLAEARDEFLLGNGEIHIEPAARDEYGHDAHCRAAGCTTDGPV